MAQVRKSANGSRSGPDFEVEERLRGQSVAPIAGVDEAGRGPLAGPVVAAAVVLDPRSLPSGLDDSKLLDKARREILFDQLYATAQIGIGLVSADEIDRLNILRATMEAMTRAVAALSPSPAVALIDGNRAPDLACRTETLVKGDQRCLSIAAASIVAKVTRDRIMCDLAREHPGYGFERHKGYPTTAHRQALATLGPCPQHRRSFRPVAEAHEGRITA